MSHIKKFTETITINSTANTTGYIPATGFINGRIVNVIHHASATPFTSNADVTMVAEGTSQTVLNIANGSTGSWVYAPRQVLHTTTGGTTGGVDYLVLANERLKVNIVDATTGNSGTFTVLVE